MLFSSLWQRDKDAYASLVFTFDELGILDQDKDRSFPLDVVLFHSDEWDNIGVEVDETSKVLTSDGGLANWNAEKSSLQSSTPQRAYCSKDNKVLLKMGPSGTTHIYHDRITLSSQNHAPYHRTFGVSKSGVYYLLMINCESGAKEQADPTASIRISGYIDFKNPYGHLSAEEYGFLPLYLIAGVTYFIVGLIWMLSMLLNFKNLIRLQIWISLLLGLQILEAGFYYMRFALQNDWDTTSPFILACSTLATIYRKSTIRLLVLALSLGYGLVRENLGSTTYFMSVLAFIHLIAGCVHEIAQISYSHLKITNATIVAILQLPLVAADAIFYVWTFIAIIRLIRQLRVRKQFQKVTLYKRFFFVLIIYGVACTLWFIYTRYHMLQSQSVRDSQWETAFTDRGVWYIMELGIFLCMMILFRPSVTRIRFSHQHQNQRYEELSTNDQISNVVDNSLNWVASLVDNNEPFEESDLEGNSSDQEVELHDMNDKSHMKRVRRRANEDESMQGFVISDDDEDIL
eukprot:CAMPEP_0117439670 /NCGR_PEP_ID=MMETSP0759-20121206/2683_1 /TAXON_ID=63605 /ORGANISM="Percolomonas cosmopolitus, Strain WS" /LENGTH=515 /DNA_ID=CAMNT_0005231389 /DNA_START=176 /DNA_END=1723 /DNA_ORIENTATION=+